MTNQITLDASNPVVLVNSLLGFLAERIGGMTENEFLDLFAEMLEDPTSERGAQGLQAFRRLMFNIEGVSNLITPAPRGSSFEEFVQMFTQQAQAQPFNFDDDREPGVDFIADSGEELPKGDLQPTQTLAGDALIQSIIEGMRQQVEASEAESQAREPTPEEKLDNDIRAILQKAFGPDVQIVNLGSID